MQDFNSVNDLIKILLPAVSIVLFFLILVLFPKYFTRWKLRKQREKEHKENLETGALGEPKIIRSLDLLEEHILKEKHKGINFWVKINHYTIPLNVAIILFGLYLGVQKGYFNNDDYFELMVYPVAILVGQISLIFSEGRIYNDLRSPVFVVRGELIKVLKERRKRRDLKVFVVRGVHFNSDENMDVGYYWDKWTDGDRVYIEYSPFTKHIWKIENV